MSDSKTTIWRNGKTNGVPVAKAIFNYLYFIVVIPVGIHLLALRGSRAGRGEPDFIGELILKNLETTGLWTFVFAVCIWFFSFLVQLRPAVIVDSTYMRVSCFGLFYSKYELSNIKSISVKNNVLFNSYLDVKFETSFHARLKCAFTYFQTPVVKDALSAHSIRVT